MKQENIPADSSVPSVPEKVAEEQPVVAASVEEKQVAWPDDLTVPEEAKEAFMQLAQKLQFSNPQIQQLVDLESRFSRQSAERQMQAAQQQQTQWAQEIQTFYGPKWEEEVSLAVRAADTFGGPELRTLLETTGLGNHPVIVRTFNEIGKRISEDVSSGGIPSVSTDKTFTEALYGNVTKGE